MYVPAHFAMDPTDASARLRGVRRASLVTIDPDAHRPVATMLPWVYREREPYGSLVSHMSRANRQWLHTTGDALVIVDGADGYVDASLLGAYDAGGNAVPTWNYETVHVYGHLVAHEDPDWQREALWELWDANTPGFDNRADPAWIDQLLRAIVTVELEITSVEAKSKLSQNKSTTDIATIADHFDTACPELADRMRTVSLPHAAERESLVDAARRTVDIGD